MSYKSDLNVFVGAKSGLFKGIKINRNACITKNIQSSISIGDNDEVTAASWIDKEEKDIVIAYGVKGNRSVKIYDTENLSFKTSFFCNRGEGRINSISKYNETLLIAFHSGEIVSWKFDQDEEFLINAGTNLNKMCHSDVDENIIATGGEENKLKIFDLEKRRQIFVEKNLPHDALELRIPISISDLVFLPGTRQLVTVGRYGYVRLYDSRIQRRPVINLKMKDLALTAVTTTPTERQVIVGSGRGTMNLIDLRKQGRVLNTYKGSVGGITGIKCSTVKPYVVSVGFDRYLRVHHIDTKEQLKKVYLTSKLTCLILRSGFLIEDEDESHMEKDSSTGNDCDKDISFTNIANNDDSEYDALFDNMEVVGNKRNKVERYEKMEKRSRLSSNSKSADQQTTDRKTRKKGKKLN